MDSKTREFEPNQQSMNISVDLKRFYKLFMVKEECEPIIPHWLVR